VIADAEIRFQEIDGPRVRDTEGYNCQQDCCNERNNEAGCRRAEAEHNLHKESVEREGGNSAVAATFGNYFHTLHSQAQWLPSYPAGAAGLTAVHFLILI